MQGSVSKETGGALPVGSETRKSGIKPESNYHHMKISDKVDIFKQYSCIKVNRGIVCALHRMGRCYAIGGNMVVFT